MARVIIDLSVALTNNMPAHKFFPRPVILPQFTHDEMETWGNGTPEDPLGGCTTFLAMMDHVGTHVDSFCHTKRGGATIDQMPLDMFMGKAVCLDMRHIPDLGDIDTKDFEEAEEESWRKDRRPHRPDLQRAAQAPLPDRQSCVVEPGHHRGGDALARRPLARAWRRRSIDRSTEQQPLSQSQSVPRSRHYALRVALQSRGTRRQGRVRIQRVAIEHLQRKRFAGARRSYARLTGGG